MISGFIPNYQNCLTIMHQFVQTETGGDPHVEALWRDYEGNLQTPDFRAALTAELGIWTTRLDRIFYHLHRLSQSASDHPYRRLKIDESGEKNKSATNGPATFPLRLGWKIRVQERIGCGGFGDIHRGARRFSGKPLAIKTLRSGIPRNVLSQVARNHRRIQILSCRPDYPSTLCRVETD